MMVEDDMPALATAVTAPNPKAVCVEEGRVEAQRLEMKSKSKDSSKLLCS